MSVKDSIYHINDNWTDIYHLLHYVHEENLSHQAVRLMQNIDKRQETTVGDLATYLGVTPNTASEHVKRLINKGFVSKVRSTEDERKVYVVLTKVGSEMLRRHTMLDEQKLGKVLENLTASDIEMINKAFSLLSKEAKKCFF
ncbi:MarR family transcriptional regulator [Alkalihalobacillus sp. LMS39]|uniref:MarR family winged helix-turn-helix transcriptional regulator n=1 Tax=Alkalihalobacillus sp. LMS39 TaxID=2924032 RepID=UPI001FB4BCEF|nr:MarR family transcriptional regulator [Alkalihalobacillus sp. LMS39]UOE95008.1 MarR family transcriptional regulator [Alkalihalobacillus sp. LMS39]